MFVYKQITYKLYWMIIARKIKQNPSLITRFILSDQMRYLRNKFETKVGDTLVKAVQIMKTDAAGRASPAHRMRDTDTVDQEKGFSLFIISNDLYLFFRECRIYIIPHCLIQT